ncbi:unnamed protein product [Pleuronectes platessa]|uniref:Uncharacterized protein n=1 Tax=Pleuronectes platessa TaxID=8262 RepID=A0A9N7UBB0_PLEPL|nr:unnamed protein product [Pleuronectes platessa]
MSEDMKGQEKMRSISHPKHTGVVRHRDRRPGAQPRQRRVHPAAVTPAARTAPPQPRLKTVIITHSISARDSSVRIEDEFVVDRVSLDDDLCSPTSGAAPFSICHGDMTHS